MSSKHRWIDDAWWRDWVFWVGIAVATGNAVGSEIRSDPAWWQHPFRFLLAFGFTVALLGFFRTVVRTYREPTSNS